MIRWLKRFIHGVFWRRNLCPVCRGYEAVGNHGPCYGCKKGSHFTTRLCVYPGCLNPWTLEKYGFNAFNEVVEWPEGWQKRPPQYIRFGTKHQAYIAIDPSTGAVDTTNWNDPTIQRMIADGIIINQV